MNRFREQHLRPAGGGGGWVVAKHWRGWQPPPPPRKFHTFTPLQQADAAVPKAPRPCHAPEAIPALQHNIVWKDDQDSTAQYSTVPERRRRSASAEVVMRRIRIHTWSPVAGIGHTSHAFGPPPEPAHALPRCPGSRRKYLGISRRECGRSAWFSPAPAWGPPKIGGSTLSKC